MTLSGRDRFSGRNSRTPSAAVTGFPELCPVPGGLPLSRCLPRGLRSLDRSFRPGLCLFGFGGEIPASAAAAFSPVFPERAAFIPPGIGQSPRRNYYFYYTTPRDSLQGIFPICGGLQPPFFNLQPEGRSDTPGRGGIQRVIPAGAFGCRTCGSGPLAGYRQIRRLNSDQGASAGIRAAPPAGGLRLPGKTN